MARTAWFGGLVCGAGGGAALAWLAATVWAPGAMAPAPPSVAPPVAAVTAAAATSSAAQPGAVGTAPSPRAQDAGRETGEVASAALLERARREFQRGWREVRPDEPPGERVELAVRDYREEVETMPYRSGRDEAARRNESDAKAALLAGDDLVALLGRVDERDDALPAFVASERFAALLRPRGGGSAVDGTSLARGPGVADGAVVAFPAGVFALPDLARQDAYPSDVIVRGAGMDATLLVAESQGPRGPLVRLTVEDCTVSASDLVDARSAPAVLTLRRVRLIGFDTGAGGSTALSANRGCALLATDCRFESGYGRAPSGYANLLRASGARLVRFERCVAERVSLDDADAASVLFVDCTFTDMLGDRPSASTLHNCRWTVLAPAQRWDPAYRSRDLNTLFPDWQRRLGR